MSQDGLTKPVSNFRSKHIDSVLYCDKKVRQTFDYRIGPVLPKFPESYSRGSRIVLKCSAQHELLGFGEFALSIQIGTSMEFDHARCVSGIDL